MSERRKLVLPQLPAIGTQETEAIEVQVGNQKVTVRAGTRATGAEEEPAPARLRGIATEVWEQGLTATEGRWNAATSSYIEVPDMKTRMKALELFLAYTHGLPVQRQVRIQQNFVDRHAEMLEVAQTSHGRKMLLDIGAIDQQWLSKYLPGDTAGDTRR